MEKYKKNVSFIKLKMLLIPSIFVSIVAFFILLIDAEKNLLGIFISLAITGYFLIFLYLITLTDIYIYTDKYIKFYFAKYCYKKVQYSNISDIVLVEAVSYGANAMRIPIGNKKIINGEKNLCKHHILLLLVNVSMIPC